MNILENRIITGLLQDDKELTRTLSAAVAQLTTQVNLMAEMFPYMMLDSLEADSFIPVEYLVEGTDKFQEQLTLLREQMLVMDQIENLRSSDETEQLAAIQYFAARNSGKTFTDRYK